jgi:hypothetical protein
MLDNIINEMNLLINDQCQWIAKPSENVVITESSYDYNMFVSNALALTHFVT